MTDRNLCHLLWTTETWHIWLRATGNISWSECFSLSGWVLVLSTHWTESLFTHQRGVLQRCPPRSICFPVGRR